MPILRDVIYNSPLKAFQLRYFALETEQNKARIKYPHIRPDSVCVCSVGNRWEPGAWQKVVEMVEHTNQKGVCCWLFEIPDRLTTLPYQALQSMRDYGCQHAHNLGFEWVMLIDNDILPEPDLILRLLQWNKSIIVPYIRDIEKKGVAAPEHEPNTGLQEIWWSVNTCLLLRCRVLNCFPNCMPFGTINLESGFYEGLYHYGHTAYQDTDTELKVTASPTYPAELRNFKEQMKYWEKADTKRRCPPDRKPINPQDKREFYLPGELKMP